MLPEWIALCRSGELLDAGEAVPFDVSYGGQTCRGFAVRHGGLALAYLNRCSHVSMEMDWQPNRFFDDTGHWLLCSTHGAVYEPASGKCVGGPCNGGLVKITLQEVDGMVFWQSTHLLKPIVF